MGLYPGDPIGSHGGKRTRQLPRALGLSILCSTRARSTIRGRGMGEPSRDRELSYELPPPTPIETSRDIRQVSHFEWSLARRARTLSRRLQAQARQLRTESQALLDRQHSMD